MYHLLNLSEQNLSLYKTYCYIRLGPRETYITPKWGHKKQNIYSIQILVKNTRSILKISNTGRGPDSGLLFLYLANSSHI